MYLDQSLAPSKTTAAGDEQHGNTNQVSNTSSPQRDAGAAPDAGEEPEADEGIESRGQGAAHLPHAEEGVGARQDDMATVYLGQAGEDWKVERLATARPSLLLGT